LGDISRPFCEARSSAVRKMVMKGPAASRKRFRASQVDLQQLREEGQHEVGVLNEVNEQLLVAAQRVAGLEEGIEAAAGLDRVIGLLVERARFLGQPGAVARIAGVGPGVTLQVIDRGLGQRRLGHLPVEGIVTVPDLAPAHAPHIDVFAGRRGRG
jgi:hypothetical protein